MIRTKHAAKPMTAFEVMQRNRNVELCNSRIFWDTFHLRLHDYLNIMTGFDVIKFDDTLHTPEGSSTRDIVLERYGETAVKLILRLLERTK